MTEELCVLWYFKGHDLIKLVMDNRVNYVESILTELDEETIDAIDRGFGIFNEKVEL